MVQYAVVTFCQHIVDMELNIERILAVAFVYKSSIDSYIRRGPVG